jgi:GTP-binding protein HflX
VVLDRVPFLLSDTVGFIRKLPHTLVESFKSTLDEVRESDVLLHVVDISHPAFEDHMKTVNETLQEIKAFDKPIIVVFNKMDLYAEKYFDELLPAKVRKEVLKELRETWEEKTEGNCVFISALERENIEAFREKMLEHIRHLYEVRYPYIAEKF